MKVLLSWLREFAPIEGDPVELGNHMSDLGMAVEEMVVMEPLDGIVVARVLDLRPHPQADRIQLVDVDAGDGAPLQVCCGAFNMSVGDLIPFATIGTVMPNGMEIAQRKMRGEMSNGMCCSAAEIGLGSDHDGIMLLPSDVELGASLMSQLGLEGDVLYDLEINPNRPDAMSVAGVARDLAARLGVPFSIPSHLPSWNVVETDEDVTSVASVALADPDLCGRFAARVLRDIKVGPSPLWMQMRLTLCGMRPISNVVDVSNYVMLELGTPNHSYDLAKVADGHIGVRRAADGGEKIVTLDDEERELAPGDGVIVNAADEAIGIAGVMGGASTEISDDTDSVLLELAWWDQESVAVTSQRLSLRSEASARFERGTDWSLNIVGVNRFCGLLNAITPGGVRVAAGVIDERGNLPEQPVVAVRTSRMSKLLGRDFTNDEIRGVLESIGFAVEATDDADVQSVTVPTFRPDTETETDVAEEVARHYGYSRLGTSVPRSPDAGHLSATQKTRRQLRQVLLGAGVSEAMPSPFLAPDAVAKAGLSVDNPVRLLNPLAVEESVLRPSLLPGLLSTIAYNESHRNVEVSLFETGHTFAPPADGSSVPDESEQLGVILAGRDAFAATHMWQTIESALGIEAALINADDLPGLHPTRAARIKVGGVDIGVVGEVDPSVLEAYGVTERCAWLDVSVGAIVAAAAGARPYDVVSTYPTSDVDLAFVVDEATQASEVEATLRSAGGAEVVSLSLFDVYRGEQLGDSKRSLAFALRLQSWQRFVSAASTLLSRRTQPLCARAWASR
jgi:phenylalanyl-tRNA synthetase beta chain